MTEALPAVDDPRWSEKMREVITRGHLAAWMKGTSERLGVPLDSPLLSQQRLSRAERAEIRDLVEAQLKYLEGFVSARPELSDAATAARSELYAGALSGTYSKARWGDWELPFHPTEGSECITNCHCHWEVTGDGATGTAIWHLGANERHCVTCPSRASNSPYSVKRRAA